MEEKKVNKKTWKMKGILFSVAAVVLLSLVASSVSAQVPSYQYNAFSYYGTQGGVPISQYYFPTVDSRSCDEGIGQDFIVEILPGSCSPGVVRSDLLEEQNVPVFCKLTGIKVNPLIDVPNIRSINIQGTPPPGIRTVLFHPYRAALKRTSVYGNLIGSPVNNDLGYVVVVLNRIPSEKDMPSVINANLTARIDYDLTTSFGITNDDLILPDLDERRWDNNFERYSFWDGKGYVRAEDIKEDSAKISIYSSQDKVIRSFNLQKGKGRSSIIYMPGMYCSAGLQVELKDVVTPRAKAVLDIDGRKSEVIEGAKILNGRCTIAEIESTPYSVGGNIKISCPEQSYTLERKGSSARFTVDGKRLKEEDYNVGDHVPIGEGNKIVDYSIAFIGKYVMFRENQEQIARDLVILQKTKGNRSLKGINKKISENLAGKFYKTDAELGAAIKKVTDQFTGVVAIWEGNNKIEDSNISISEVKGISQANYPDIVEKYYRIYKDSYQKIVEDLPNQKAGPNETFYGERVLWNAAETARKMGKEYDMAQIYENLIDKYPQSNYVKLAKKNLENLYSAGSAESASSIISTSGRVFYVSLEKVVEPTADELSVDLFVNGVRYDKLGISDFIGEDKSWVITEINDKSVKFERISEKKDARIDRVISVGSLSALDALQVKVQGVNLEKLAIVSVYPYSKEGKTFANFSVNIGIEKRAIKLSVDQTKDLINKLDKTIDDLEKLTSKLGNVVEDWKKVCLAGSTAIWVANFFDDLISEGEAIARRFVMREMDIEGHKGWVSWCNNPTNWQRMGEFGIEGDAKDFDECIFKSGDEIEKSVKAGERSIKDWGKIVDKYRSKKTGVITEEGGVFGFFKREKVNETKLMSLIQENVFAEYNASNIRDNEIISQFSTLYAKEYVGKEDAKDLYFDMGISLQCREEEGGLKLSTPFCKSVEKRLSGRLNRYDSLLDELNRETDAKSTFNYFGYTGLKLVTNVKKPDDAFILKFKDVNPELKDILKKADPKLDDEKTVALFPSSIVKEVAGTEKSTQIVASGSFVAVVTKIAGDRYNVVDRTYYHVEKDKARLATEEEKNALFLQASTFSSQQRCSATYVNPQVQYWGAGPFKGLPAILPIGKALDGSTGWYAATKPYEGTLTSGITDARAYTEGGEPTQFYIANIGDNGRPDFGTSPGGDDTCGQFFALSETYSGQTKLGGMTEKQTQRFVEKSVRCLKEAANQAKTAKGGKIKTSCVSEIIVGEVKAPTPALECEDFMNPKWCNLLYNLCDPVICPPSRCDLGGRFPVDNVVQTGIVGSLALCLPNWAPLREGGVVVPICMTGVHAGLENLQTVFESTRGCLQESLETGRHVGICDQLQSVYLCEFFWRELSPFIKTGLPQLIERKVFGRGGGGEYLSFSESYDRSLQQVQFFTNYYGANMLKAFKVRTTQEAGSLICKAFVGVRYPDSASIFDELAKPESPPQINAWFDDISFSSVTVPPTSQYKVFWHIFAGRDEPAYWQVYLKNPPFSPGVILPSTYVIQTGYAPRGEYVTETRDFTAPSGYKELCVRLNLKEYCGFKKVTTGFASEYLTDQYLKDQAVKEEIKTERDCTSGKAGFVPQSLIPLLTQPGQGALEEALQPEIYKRGIVRICSSDNPGKGTEPERWNRVGSCDDGGKISCWLDRSSVEGAIKDLKLENITLQRALNASNKLFEEIEDFNTVEESGVTLKKLEENKEVDKLKTEIRNRFKGIKSSELRNVNKVKEIEDFLDGILKSKTVTSLKNLVEFSIEKNHRARAQTHLVDIYDTIVLSLRGAPITSSGGVSIGSTTPVKLKAAYNLGGNTIKLIDDSFNEKISQAEEGQVMVVTGYYLGSESEDAALERGNAIHDYISKNYESQLKKKEVSLSYKDGKKSTKEFDLSLTDCELTNIRWNDKTALTRSVVPWTVIGQGQCGGLYINVHVLEDNTWPFPNVEVAYIKDFLGEQSGPIAKISDLGGFQSLINAEGEFILRASFTYGNEIESDKNVLLVTNNDYTYKLDKEEPVYLLVRAFSYDEHEFRVKNADVIYGKEDNSKINKGSVVEVTLNYNKYSNVPEEIKSKLVEKV